MTLSVLNYRIRCENAITGEKIEWSSIDSALSVDIDTLQDIQNPRVSFMMLRVYNLTQSTYSKLERDTPIVYTITDNQVKKQTISIVLEAAFGDSFRTVYAGSLVKGYTQETENETITYLHVVDGYELFATPASASFGQGTPVSEVLRYLTQDIDVKYGIKGVAGAVQGVLKNDVAMYKDGLTSMQENINPEFDMYVEHQMVKFLKRGEYLGNDKAKPFLVSSNVNMIKSAVQNAILYEFGVIFEPNLLLGQKVIIESEQTRYNGEYKIIKIIHSGAITFKAEQESRMVTTLTLASSRLLKIATDLNVLIEK